MQRYWYEGTIYVMADNPDDALERVYRVAAWNNVVIDVVDGGAVYTNKYWHDVAIFMEAESQEDADLYLRGMHWPYGVTYEVTDGGVAE